MTELVATGGCQCGADAGFMASIVSNQHPDHDTETWPPQGFAT